ncbi:alanine--tRNA ligase [Candidatus Microgenomates bacterium]|nr:alanine--tRNA ligase [Candidatus Microgenomates bacterium]
MTSHEIRQKYFEFFAKRDHQLIPRAKLVPENDPTTLFTGSGMQPLLPYLLGQKHPAGKKLVNSQTCFRAEDIAEVGDSRHTTFFEMLGNWGLGDYFKAEQLPWFWEFLTKTLKLDPQRLYVTCYAGDESLGVPKDTESAEIWEKLFAKSNIKAKQVDMGDAKAGSQEGMQAGRIFFYRDKNWWSRVGEPANMPEGEPGGPDSEVFYEFKNVKHDPKFGKQCHPNCDCGRFSEIGNSVFMQYVKTSDGFMELPQQNVDFGGGLERLTAAVQDTPDMFRIDTVWPIIERLAELSGKTYEDHAEAKRVIADHLRAAVFLATDGVEPSNKESGYVLRRLLRRAVRYGLDLGIDQGLLKAVAPVVVDIYKEAYPEVLEHQGHVELVLDKEEKIFRQTLRRGLREFEKVTQDGLSGEEIFTLYDTYGFPVELATEEAKNRGIELAKDWRQVFSQKLEEQRARSRTAGKGQFKGGLAGHSEIETRYHTATHIMYRALKEVLGDDVVQKGANITEERIRFDFTHPEKVTPEQIKRVEDIVNQKIKEDLSVKWEEYDTKEALTKGAYGAFGDRYGERVKVYSIGDGKNRFSFEICGGPHVEHTGQIGESGKRFKIIKEEASSAGVRRVKAVLQ